MQSITYNHTTWLNLKSPTKEDIDYVKDNFVLHPLIIEELSTPTRHSKINFYGEHFFLVLHFPVFDKDKKKVIPFEVDVIFTKEAIITLQYGGRHEELEKMFREIEDSEDIKKEYMNQGSGFLLYKLLERLFDSLFPQLDNIIKRVDATEKEVFSKQEIATATEIASFRSEASDFRRAIKPNSTILRILNTKGTNIWGDELIPYYIDIENTNERIAELIENEVETLGILYDTTQTLISNKLNEVMKTLTIFAVIVFPLTLFSSIWGMNVQNMPIVGRPNDFWLIMGLMALTTSAMLLYFKLKKWL